MRRWKKSRRIIQVGRDRQSVCCHPCHALRSTSNLQYLHHGLQLLFALSQTSESSANPASSASQPETPLLEPFSHETALLPRGQSLLVLFPPLRPLTSIHQRSDRRKAHRELWKMDPHHTVAPQSSRACTASRIQACLNAHPQMPMRVDRVHRRRGVPPRRSSKRQLEVSQLVQNLLWPTMAIAIRRSKRRD
jgi:hypothetical protein